MGKHDHPSMQFKVDGGRLVPAGPYEAEVLEAYQRGSEITVTLHQRRSLPLLKKYWAVLRDVVENCKTPWNSPDEASDALKLALGVTDIGKTVKGQWFVRAGSISFASMDQAAFRDFFEKAMAILAEVTGIDPDSLRDRYSHLPEQDHQSSDGGSPSATDDSGGETPSLPAATDTAGECGETAGADDMGENEQKAPAEPSVPAGIRMVMEECIDNMLRDAFSEPKDQQSTKVEKLREVFLEPQNLGDYPAFVNRCADTVLCIIGKPGERDRAKEYLEDQIGRAA